LERDLVVSLNFYAQELRDRLNVVVLSFGERHSFFDYESLCSYALYLSRLGGGLPDDLRVRLTFGGSNHYVRCYVEEFCG
jgi:hypothetical protein